MNSIISYLVLYNQFLITQINQLVVFIVKNIPLGDPPKGSFSFAFRKFSPHIMGLCLTYHVNLSLSTRATARALWEIHQVKISHVMVSKYAKAASVIVKPFVDSFDYKPTFIN